MFTLAGASRPTGRHPMSSPLTDQRAPASLLNLTLQYFYAHSHTLQARLSPSLTAFYAARMLP